MANPFKDAAEIAAGKKKKQDLAPDKNVGNVPTPKKSPIQEAAKKAAGGATPPVNQPQAAGVTGPMFVDNRDPQRDQEWLKYKQRYEASQNPEEKRLALLKMRYREARLRGDQQTQNQLATEIQGLETSLGTADIFNERLDQSSIDARRAYQRATDISVARQARGVQNRAQELIDRMGLSEGMAAQMIVGAEAALGALGIEKMADFDAQMQAINQAQEMGFLQNQFGFFNELVKMRYNTDFEKELMSHQAKLQKDLQRQQMWGSALSALGSGIGSLLPGIGSLPGIGNLFGGGGQIQGGHPVNLETGESLYGPPRPINR